MSVPGRSGRGPGRSGSGPGTWPDRGPRDGGHGRGGWDWKHHQPRHYNNHYYYSYPGWWGLGSFVFGFWIGAAAGCYDPYCYYSPFYYYGLPYVYAPRVRVVEVPVYTYTEVPSYSYGNGYYLSRGQYTGLDAALDDIRTAWTSGNADLLMRHIDAGTQIAIYLNGGYLYSLPGTDYRDMVRDAMSHVRTVSFTFDNVERRSDGAYTATGTHQFYDVDNNLKTVTVSHTLSRAGSTWIVVAAGSSEAT